LLNPECILFQIRWILLNCHGILSKSAKDQFYNKLQVVQIMNFAKILLLTIYFFFGSLVLQVEELKAQDGFLETESIRQKLFSRMDDRKKSKPLRTISENILIGVAELLIQKVSGYVSKAVLNFVNGHSNSQSRI